MFLVMDVRVFAVTVEYSVPLGRRLMIPLLSLRHTIEEYRSNTALVSGDIDVDEGAFGRIECRGNPRMGAH